jgi:hypothetical protein
MISQRAFEPATPSRLVLVYHLKLDKQHVEAVQRATAATKTFGILRTHGLFGSDEWWGNIKSGKLPVYSASGIISRLYLSGMRDMPEFTLRSDNGEESNWLRKANSKAMDEFYVVGRRVEINFVLQRNRFFSDGIWPKRHPVVIEIRIGK